MLVETFKDDKIWTLYHGSSVIVKKPMYGAGKKDNDYGSGFYLTAEHEKANEWAFTTDTSDKAVCNTYRLDTRDLTIVHLNDYGPLAWIAEVAFNRGVESDIDSVYIDTFLRYYKLDLSKADVIVGYRADDSYTKVISAFFNNELTVDEVDAFFRKGELGEQVFIKSPKAFDQLSFVDAVVLDPALKENAGNAERIARRDVSALLDNRSKAIRFEHFDPSSKGCAMLDVVSRKFVYVDGYYQKEEPKPAKKIDEMGGLTR